MSRSAPPRLPLLPGAYAELAAATNFSFLQGASPAADLVLTSLLLGHTGLGIADRNTVAGVVRAWGTLRELREGGALPPLKLRQGGSPGDYRIELRPLVPGGEDAALRAEVQARAQRFRLVTGARLCFADGTPDIVTYPQHRAGWARLCRLLTTGNRRAVKGSCHLTLDDLLEDPAGLLFLVMPGRPLEPALAQVLSRLEAAAPGAVWLGAAMPRRGDDRRRLAALGALADQAGVKLLATNDVLYADPQQRPLQDILTCIRLGRTLENAGRLLEANAERHLKHAAEMARLFADHPSALLETQRLLARVEFDLGQLSYQYPDEPVPAGWQAQSWLEELTFRHAAGRYPAGLPPKVERLLHQELALIAKLNYAPYFLTIHDIVQVAREKGILCQGRGSAANSAVCYVLGITSVDPAEHNVLFARFISEERKEPPDIDVDFEHERREEVIQHIYARYGRERAGLAATVIHYRPKSAIREVGKVLGLPEDVTTALSGTQWGSWGSDITRNQVRQAGLDPDNPLIARAVDFARRLIGFPRHLSQHVGGFVLTRDRLDELVPVGNAAMADRTFIEWDKDDIDMLGLMKVDVLALGMLTCIRKAFELLKDHERLDMTLADVPQDDRATYDMLCKGDSIGVFQVESRAQINMLPRLKPREFYDLVIQVAIVRPGPIQGNMVHPYLKRRSGEEAVVFPSPAPEHGPADELHQVLGKTRGVPLFQEQAMQLAMVAAKFSDVEANQLRRAMATFRNVGTIGEFEGLMVERMVARGYDREFAENCFRQIQGFGSYGFPESHAASFAKLVYVSSWLKCHHPAIFACALLNSQPMGFYAPAQIVRDAQEHGVEVRAVDVNESYWDNTLERGRDGRLALRLGFRQAEGIHEAEARRLVAARQNGFAVVEDVARRARLYGRPMRALADADAFGSIGLDRRSALWEVRRLPQDDPLPLFAAVDARELGAEADAALPRMALGEQVATDYQTLRLSLKAHPMLLLRERLAREGVCSAAETCRRAEGRFTRMAGLVLVRQRPGKGNAIFITLEDETGIVNCVLWARRFEALRGAVMGSRLMLVEGRVQRSAEGVIHLMLSNVIDRSALLGTLWTAEAPGSEVIPPQPQRSQGAGQPVRPAAHPTSTLATPPRHVHPRDVRILPKSRDFH
ncbi:error-prone DNA polymerase [Pannonibacter tanglangensis]|uniref:Error-prone DNA polymerase n=1 Tax=Pannonibacter tanglangensis TaxID=2750084 RepID=A0ABW9ZKL3_9HYPH|nr:error-prone DNA polymerase [Pannonibacter sp. XCT-34]NBN65366.1 DNA polymerase III subunit alpha [Pannonibacter sp. XCT-34]